jgi:hypothetical protein
MTDMATLQKREQVDLFLDTSRASFRQLGEAYYKAFGSERNNASSQVRNLQQIVYSATRFSDIEDFVKNQMGKKREQWLQVGQDTLSQLDGLRECAERIAGSDPAIALNLRLGLARGWMRTVVSEYLYHLAIDQMP